MSYMRRWECESCNAAMVSPGWPDEAICDRCERKRNRRAESEAVRFAGEYLRVHAKGFVMRSMSQRCWEVAKRLERESR